MDIFLQMSQVYDLLLTTDTNGHLLNTSKSVFLTRVSKWSITIITNEQIFLCFTLTQYLSMQE